MSLKALLARMHYPKGYLFDLALRDFGLDPKAIPQEYQNPQAHYKDIQGSDKILFSNVVANVRGDRIDLALKALNQAIEIEPANPANYYRRGLILMYFDQSQAYDSFAAAWKLDNTYRAKWLGFIAYQIRSYSGFVDLKINPRILFEKLTHEFGGVIPQGIIDLFVNGYLQSASTYELSNHSMAIEQLTAAMSFDLQAYQLYRYRGELYLKLGDTQAAIDDFEFHLSMNPYHFEGNRLLAWVYEINNERDRSLACYQRMIEIGKFDLEEGRLEEACRKLNCVISRLSNSNPRSDLIATAKAYLGLAHHDGMTAYRLLDEFHKFTPGQNTKNSVMYADVEMRSKVALHHARLAAKYNPDLYMAYKYYFYAFYYPGNQTTVINELTDLVIKNSRENATSSTIDTTYSHFKTLIQEIQDSIQQLQSACVNPVDMQTLKSIIELLTAVLEKVSEVALDCYVKGQHQEAVTILQPARVLMDVTQIPDDLKFKISHTLAQVAIESGNRENQGVAYLLDAYRLSLGLDMPVWSDEILAQALQSSLDYAQSEVGSQSRHGVDALRRAVAEWPSPQTYTALFSAYYYNREYQSAFEIYLKAFETDNVNDELQNEMRDFFADVNVSKGFKSAELFDLIKRSPQAMQIPILQLCLQAGSSWNAFITRNQSFLQKTGVFAVNIVSEMQKYLRTLELTAVSESVVASMGSPIASSSMSQVRLTPIMWQKQQAKRSQKPITSNDDNPFNPVVRDDVFSL